MGLDRRHMLKLGAASCAWATLPQSIALAQSISEQGSSGESMPHALRSHASSLIGAPKYPDGFTHFDYANPDAPKGGTAKLSYPAAFDGLNPFISKGTPVSVIRTLVFETLMKTPYDEGSTMYGLIAEWVEHPADQSQVSFKIREQARWQDGRPITVADIKASFSLLVEKGQPLWRYYYQNVREIRDDGNGIVTFLFDQTGNRELPHIMGQLPILPAHDWEDRDFENASLTPPLGSGPYRIGAFEAGRFIEFERVPDYWGADLPVRRGQDNFDTLRFEVFLDRDAAFEGFKKGVIDYWDENSASRWAEKYTFPAVKSGKIVKQEVTQEGPKQLQGFVFNLRREKFADRRTREAINLAFDFEWTNRAVFFEQYARPSSFFQGSPGLMASGVPDAAEKALLEPFAAELPAGIFDKPFENPVSDGSGRNRGNLRKATRLLAEAGWVLDGRRLKNAAGETFTLEFLNTSASQEKLIGPFIQNLEKLGIDASFRQIDTSQYISRLREHDFDMVINAWFNSESPGNEQREYWGSASASAPGGRNLSGVSSPVIDALIDKIILAPDRDALESASRALDRVLLWEHYAVLELYTPYERIAYWDRFGAPDPLPARDIGFPSVWWFDQEKAARL
ncbi:MAG: extracellular solute-binding protein [Neomegalonema sp.]|nr:extracellular solute-binding protein [Neomegalonema sp.]